MHIAIMSLFVWIIYLFIFTICLANTINPKWMWEKFESWQSTKEPSKEYFIVRRIGAIICLLVITFIMVAPTISAYLD